MRELAGETLALAHKAALVRRNEILRDRREDAESLAADLCFYRYVKTLVVVYDVVAARIFGGDCFKRFCEFRRIPLDVEARHRTFVDELAVD